MYAHLYLYVYSYFVSVFAFVLAIVFTCFCLIQVYTYNSCHLCISRYVYNLHETVNSMLKKKSGLTYCDIRERYEHFRSRCTEEKPVMFNFKKSRKKTEVGCTEPLYGKKSKCVINIVPHEERVNTFNIDKK